MDLRPGESRPAFLRTGPARAQAEWRGFAIFLGGSGDRVARSRTLISGFRFKSSIHLEMSTIGSPIETSLLQTTQAQQKAARTRDRERAEASERSRRIADLVELRVAGVEEASAVRPASTNDPDVPVEDDTRRRADGDAPAELAETSHVDLTA